MDLDVRAIARRAAGRVLAERGLAGHGRPHPAGPALAGVQVVAGTPRQAARGGARGGKERGRALVSASDLVAVPDGGALAVPEGALVTPLAEEEAQRRGLRLQGSGASRRLRVAIGSDHGGFALKRDVIAWIGEFGHRAVDFGTRDENPVDYPDFACAVAEAVASGQCDLGVCLDGAGIGSAIAANKVPGVRAATCCDVRMARNAREHNFANVLSLGARALAPALAREILAAFLATDEGGERHARRVAKIEAIERRYGGSRSRGPLPLRSDGAPQSTAAPRSQATGSRGVR